MPKRKATESIYDDRGSQQDGYTNYAFYAEKQYWCGRYVKDRGETFEWFSKVEPLIPLLTLLIPGSESTVLEIGCGTSQLLTALRQSSQHFGDLIGIDFSPEAVASATSDANKSCVSPTPRYLLADARDLSNVASECSIDAVIEKGTFAGMLSSPNGEEIMAGVLAEVHRVLTDDGILISLSPHDPEDPTEGKNGLVVLEEMLLPPLLHAAEATGHYYTVDIHSGESFRGIHAYVLRKRLRKRTRSAVRGELMPTTIKCHQH
eukprot:gene14108-16684_t